MGELVEQVRALVGKAVSDSVIQYYLVQAEGDTAEAVGLFFDAQQREEKSSLPSGAEVEAMLAQISAVVGPGVSREAALHYLKDAGYDVAEAIDTFVESGAVLAQPDSKKAPPQRNRANRPPPKEHLTIDEKLEIECHLDILPYISSESYLDASSHTQNTTESNTHTV